MLSKITGVVLYTSQDQNFGEAQEFMSSHKIVGTVMMTDPAYGLHIVIIGGSPLGLRAEWIKGRWVATKKKEAHHVLRYASF